MDFAITKQLISITAVLTAFVVGIALVPYLSTLILVTVAAFGLAAILWKHLEWGLYAMALLYPTISFQFVRGSINVPYVDLIAMAVGLVWAVTLLYARMVKKERVSLEISALTWLMGLFLASAGLSLLGIAPELFNAGVKFIFRPLLFFYLLFVIVPYNVISSKKQLFTVFNIMFVLGLLVSIMGLYTLITQPIQGVVRAIPTDVFGIWFLGSNHNQIAETLVMLIPVGFILYWTEKVKEDKNIYLIGTIFMIAINFLTLSRSGWLAGGIELALIAGFVYKDKVRRFMKSYGLYVVLATLLPVLYLMYRWAISSVSMSSNSNRFKLIEIAETLFSENPFFGVGVGTFIAKVNSMQWYIIEYGAPLDAHGFLFKTMAEMGLFGAISFSLLLGYIVYMLYKHFVAQKGTEYAPVALGVMLMVIGGVVFQFFGTNVFTSILWFPIGVSLASTKFGFAQQT